MKAAHEHAPAKRAERSPQAAAAPKTKTIDRPSLAARGLTQDALGNRGLIRALRGRSASKVTVSHPGDAAEHAADRAADVAMNSTAVAPTLNGGGSLDEQTRTLMESRFGQSFADVRIHTGNDAAETAAGLRARAFTVGSDIVFGHGQYAPGTTAGRRLLAHELAHVVQQRQPHGPIASLGTAEHDANQAAHAIAGGGGASVRVRAQSGTIQRQPEEEAGQISTSKPRVSTTTSTFTSEASRVIVSVEGRQVAGGGTSSFDHPKDDGGTWDSSAQTLTIRVFLARFATLSATSNASAVARDLNIRLLVIIPIIDGNEETPIVITPAPPKAKPPAPHPRPPAPKPLPKKLPPPGPTVDVDFPLKTDTPLLRPKSRAERTLRQALAEDPLQVPEAAARLTDQELRDLDVADRLAVIRAIAGYGLASDAETLQRLLSTTPNRDAGEVLDALNADNGRLLRDLQETLPDTGVQLGLSMMDLGARRTDRLIYSPLDAPKLDFDLSALLSGARRDPTEVIYLGDKSLQPSWMKGLRFWKDAQGNTNIASPELGIATWDMTGKRLNVPPPGYAEMARALRGMEYLAQTGGKRYVGGKALDEAEWKDYLQQQANAISTEQGRQFQNLAGGVQAWEETQSGIARIPSFFAHTLGGRSSDDPSRILAQTSQNIDIARNMILRANTPEELAEAKRYATGVTRFGEHEFYLYKEDVFAGGERTIVVIEVTAAAATAYYTAPFLLTYGGAAVTLKGLAIGAGAGATLSFARQGVEKWQGTRKEFSLTEIGVGAGMGAGVVLVPEFAPIMTGMGVASSANEFSQGHFKTGTFDLATSMLPFAMKGAPEAIQWAKPRIARVALPIFIGVRDVPSLGGQTFTPDIPNRPQIVLVDPAGRAIDTGAPSVAFPEASPGAPTAGRAGAWRTVPVGGDLPSPYDLAPIIVSLNATPAGPEVFGELSAELGLETPGTRTVAPRRNQYPSFESIPQQSSGLRSVAQDQAQRLSGQLGINVPADRVLQAPWTGRVRNAAGDVTSRGTSQGWLRSEAAFWRAFKREFPSDYALLGPGKTVTKAFAERYGWPTDGPDNVVGQPLIHHHMENGTLVVAIPESLHVDLSGVIHARPTVVARP